MAGLRLEQADEEGRMKTTRKIRAPCIRPIVRSSAPRSEPRTTISAMPPGIPAK
ncbi:hypothetical protein ACFSLT_12415 [Novosphingobium resinovorum]